MATAITAWLLRQPVWQWQQTTWQGLATRLGVAAESVAFGIRWNQAFVTFSLPEAVAASVIVLVLTYVIFRSTVIPTVKGLYAVIVIPLYLYGLVTALTGDAPSAALTHLGMEWLYGEVVLWFLIAALYALFVFPVPFSLVAKLGSLATVLGVSLLWRTATPVLYIFIAVHSQGVLAPSAWMFLGPWADYLYIIPLFSVTLTFYRGGSPDDYRI